MNLPDNYFLGRKLAFYYSRGLITEHCNTKHNGIPNVFKFGIPMVRFLEWSVIAILIAMVPTIVNGRLS